MDLEIPYLRIRDFESQNLEKLLDKERPPDKPCFGDNKDFKDYKPESEPEDKFRQSGFFTGDSYSKSVDLILESIGLEKYIENFKSNDIGVNILVHMDEDDLAEIGITDFVDQALFKKKLSDFRGTRGRMNRSVYKIEEDLIMAQNICSHLEDINNHLNLVQFYLKKNKFEDYFVNPKKSILGVFNIVMDRALVQNKKMKDELFTGRFDSDQLIPALLKADNLELPEFMTAKLYKPDKSFRFKPGRNKSLLMAIQILAGLTVGFSALAFLIYKRDK